MQDYYRVTEGDNRDKAELLKNIPAPKQGREPTLEEVVTAYPKLATDKRFAEFYEHAKKIEGMVNKSGVHAAGVVIADVPLYELIPLQRKTDTATGKTYERVTQFSMGEVESLGVLKFDFLGLDTLSIAKEAVRLIKERHGVEIDLYSIEDGCQKTYAMMAEGLLTGVFQMETSSMAKSYIQRIRPTSIEMLSDISAMNRPGPQEAGLDEEYIENLNRGYIESDLPDVVLELVKDTQGCILYQEQIMNICSKIAGFTLQEADSVRRAMG